MKFVLFLREFDFIRFLNDNPRRNPATIERPIRFNEWYVIRMTSKQIHITIWTVAILFSSITCYSKEQYKNPIMTFSYTPMKFIEDYIFDLIPFVIDICQYTYLFLKGLVRLTCKLKNHFHNESGTYIIFGIIELCKHQQLYDCNYFFIKYR